MRSFLELSNNSGYHKLSYKDSVNINLYVDLIVLTEEKRIFVLLSSMKFISLVFKNQVSSIKIVINNRLVQNS